MYRIQTNTSGTRSICLTEEHLKTIEKYTLFDGIVSSNGIVDENTLDKLRNNVRSYILRNEDCKDLMEFAKNVLFHDNMKVYGLKELIMLYVDWYDESTKNENQQQE